MKTLKEYQIIFRDTNGYETVWAGYQFDFNGYCATWNGTDGEGGIATWGEALHEFMKAYRWLEDNKPKLSGPVELKIIQKIDGLKETETKHCVHFMGKEVLT